MDVLQMLSRQPVFHALEQALLGFFWQGAAVALAVAGLLALLPQGAARARYATACLGLLAMAVLPGLSFLTALADAARLLPSGDLSAEPLGLVAPAAHVTVVAPLASPEGHVPWAGLLRPWLLPAWCCGVLLLSTRTALAWLLTQRLSRQATHEPAAPWREALERAQARLRMSGPVRLLASARIDVPMVIGLWRPLILVPAGAISGLTPAQLEAILAHELAHIRRHDYLVNLLQSLVETLLFYHPAVWWLSRTIREEREHCADDLAVQCCGDAYLYARALAHIEQLRAPPSPQPALGASGGSLLMRVRRLLVVSSGSATQPLPWRLASSLGGAMLVTLLGASQVPETARAEPSPAPAAGLVKPAPRRSPVPERTASAPRLLVAPDSAAPARAPMPVRPARPPVRAAPREAKAPEVKAPEPGPAPLLIPDMQAIARTELPRVPYTLDAEPAPAPAGAGPAEEAGPPPPVTELAPAPAAEPSEPEVLALRPGITPPRFLSGERFHYPNLAYGIQAQLGSFPKGSVVARCTITATGSVTGCKPLQGLRGLEEAVIRTLSTWRYEPAMLEGKPVAVHYVFDIWFTNEPGGGPSRQLASLDTNPVTEVTAPAAQPLARLEPGQVLGAAAPGSCGACKRFVNGFARDHAGGI